MITWGEQSDLTQSRKINKNTYSSEVFRWNLRFYQSFVFLLRQQLELRSAGRILLPEGFHQELSLGQDLLLAHAAGGQLHLHDVHHLQRGKSKLLSLLLLGSILPDLLQFRPN